MKVFKIMLSSTIILMAIALFNSNDESKKVNSNLEFKEASYLSQDVHKSLQKLEESINEKRKRQN